jgi:hypothetical protein
MTTAIVAYRAPSREFDPEARMLALFLMYARAPRRPAPDETGFYSLGEIGSAPEKTWMKATPYSISEPKT